MRASTLASLPPALVITAECDPCRDEAEAYAAALADAGVSARVHRCDGLAHGVFNMDLVIPRAREIGDAATAFLAAHL